MKTAFRTFVALTGLAVTIGVNAQTTTTKIDQRETNQQTRVQNGVATGALSNREAVRMEAGQAKVAKMEDAAKADGKVTRAERKAINRQQNKQSRRIHRQKHDGNNK